MAPANANVSTGEDEFITIARIAKTQGRKGEVAAALLTDFPERFATRKKLFALCDAAAVERNTRLNPADQAQRRELEARRRELKLEDHWFHKGMVVLKFAGVDSISDAETLVGCEIQIPLSDRAELGSDEFYVSDLAGCTVTDSGREIGRIKDVQFGSGEAPLLVVQGEKEQLVPFAAAYIEKVDLEQRRVSMKLPPGLLELDAPLSQEEKQQQQKKSLD
ncbi:MAG TPA: ribosome maturation factor RimM [Candidatus Angelobacter sp.]|nr:ribosome maturation factor RimM [Candidatus Angelobacter sp.]